MFFHVEKPVFTAAKGNNLPNIFCPPLFWYKIFDTYGNDR